MDEDRLARLQLGVVEQHVLHGAEADRRAGRLLEGDALRHRDHEPLGPVDQLAGEAVDMEAHDAGDVLAEIVPALPAGPAMAAGLGAVHGHRVARLEPRDALADRRDLARGLDAHGLGHLALGEGHAAKAPDVEVVERQRLAPAPAPRPEPGGGGASISVMRRSRSPKSWRERMETILFGVIPGRVPEIRVLLGKTWMAGTSPAMTRRNHWRRLKARRPDGKSCPTHMAAKSIPRRV